MKTKTKEIHQCYCCERMVTPDEGEWTTIFYNEFETQVFMCHGCIEEDEKLTEGYDWQTEG